MRVTMPTTAMLSLLVTEGMRQAEVFVAAIAFAISVPNRTSSASLQQQLNYGTF